jgi:hypothetical protein
MSGRGIWTHADIVKHSKIRSKNTEIAVILSYCIRGLAKTKVGYHAGLLLISTGAKSRRKNMRIRNSIRKTIGEAALPTTPMLSINTAVSSAKC